MKKDFKVTVLKEEKKYIVIFLDFWQAITFCFVNARKQPKLQVSYIFFVNKMRQTFVSG